MNTTTTNSSTAREKLKSASGEPASTGVLVVNLGTPDSPATADVRRYLREFLSDRRVVDVNRALWWPLLYGVILPLRSPKSAHAYSKIWTSAGSPLLVESRKLTELLASELGPTHSVELAMRYGKPSVESGVRALVARGCERIVVLALFPQYCEATVGSVNAEVSRVVARLAKRPVLGFVQAWFEDGGYIAALRDSCRASAPADRPVSHWVFSFHGVPERYVERGDPYRDHCERTARALAASMGLNADGWTLAFQSRFGREPWLQPYVDLLVPSLARTHPRLGIVTPGFTADCLETLEEIGIRLRADFLAAGGEDLVVVPCLNGSANLARSLAARVRAVET